MKKVFGIVLFSLLLAACGTSRRVVVEPRPSGLRPWQRPYSVDGERYVPLQKAEGFREEGLASWYGGEEHGNLTSNGESFDRNKPSAAHKTLPLGCYLRVTNKVNGRKTMVRVNDRGPFARGRIVDLSYRAALDLDMVAQGVAPVLIEVVPSASGNSGMATGPEAVSVLPAEARNGDEGAVSGPRIQPQAGSGSVGQRGDLMPPQKSVTGGSSPPGYTLQVGAFSEREKARVVMERLKTELAYAVVQESDTGRQHVFRVRAGRFRSRADAEAARFRLVSRGYPDAFVVSE